QRELRLPVHLDEPEAKRKLSEAQVFAFNRAHAPRSHQAMARKDATSTRQVDHANHTTNKRRRVKSDESGEANRCTSDNSGSNSTATAPHAPSRRMSRAKPTTNKLTAANTRNAVKWKNFWLASKPTRVAHVRTPAWLSDMMFSKFTA